VHILHAPPQAIAGNGWIGPTFFFPSLLCRLWGPPLPATKEKTQQILVTFPSRFLDLLLHTNLFSFSFGFAFFSISGGRLWGQGVWFVVGRSFGFCRAWIAGIGLGDTGADGGAAVLRWCCCRFWEPKSQSTGWLYFFSFRREGATRRGRWGFWCFGERSSICGAMVVAEELVSGEVRELWPGVCGWLKREEEGEAAVGRDSRERERSVKNRGKIGHGLWFWEMRFSVFDKGKERWLAFEKDESFALLGFSFFLYYSPRTFSSLFFFFFTVDWYL